MRALKKIMAALALTAVLAGCSADNILSSIQGGKADTVQKLSLIHISEPTRRS